MDKHTHTHTHTHKQTSIRTDILPFYRLEYRDVHVLNMCSKTEQIRLPCLIARRS